MASTLSDASATLPTVLAELDGEIGSIAADETTLYIVTSTRVVSIPKQGGAAVTLAGGSDSAPDDALWGIAVDDTYVYFTMGGTTFQGKRSVARVSKTGGPVETIVTNVQYASAVAIEQGELYILGGGVFQAPVTGGTAVGVPGASGSFRGWLIADDALWLTTDQPPYESMPLVGTPPDAALFRVPLAGGPATVVATSIGEFAAGLALVGDQIAVAEGGIQLFPTAGGPRSSLDAFPVDPEALASDGTALYGKMDEQTVCVTDCRAGGTNALFRIDAAGKATVLARWVYPPGNTEPPSTNPPPGTKHLVLDEQNVYLLEHAQGQPPRVLAARRDVGGIP